MQDMQELRAAFDKDMATLREQYLAFIGEQPKSWYVKCVTEEMRKLYAEMKGNSEMKGKYPRSWFPRGK